MYFIYYILYIIFYIHLSLNLCRLQKVEWPVTVTVILTFSNCSCIYLCWDLFFSSDSFELLTTVVHFML